MSEYATDEEQVEALKKWWKENGFYLIGGIVLGLGLLIGWNYWKTYRVAQGEDGSAVYAELMQNSAAAGDKTDSLLNELESNYSGTPYYTLGLLQKAKIAVGKSDWAAAESALRKAIDSGTDLNLTDMARLRLARVLLSAGDADAALSEAAKVSGSTYLSLREEVRGDALVAKGDHAQAREAYDKALLSAGGRADFLQLKRDNLGPGKAES